MVARKWAQISFCFALIFSSACAGEVTLSENDHTLFPLVLSDRDNHVLYNVTTDGQCAITNVFPCWKMDDEDGHLQELDWWEVPIYGVDNLSRQSDEIWSFNVAKYPDKVVKATVISVESENDDGDSVVICNFVGISVIDKTEAILNEVLVDNDGNTVHSVSFFGDSVSSATPVSETVKP